MRNKYYCLKKISKGSYLKTVTYKRLFEDDVYQRVNTMMFFPRAVVAFISAAVCMVSFAASIEQQDFKQLYSKSALIFDGEVLDIESRWNPERTSINTWVEFSVGEVLKGTWPEDSIVLRFKGGQVEEMQLEIPGLIYPELGEQGIYFVESIENTQFNPLLGWSQGHFKIGKDKDGHERIRTAKGKPVINIDETVESQSALYEKGLLRASRPSASRHATDGLSEGRALGVYVGDAAALDAAMTKQAFKRKIRQMQSDEFRQAQQPSRNN